MSSGSPVVPCWWVGMRVDGHGESNGRSPFAIFQMHLKIKLPHYTFIFTVTAPILKACHC